MLGAKFSDILVFTSEKYFSFSFEMARRGGAGDDRRTFVVTDFSIRVRGSSFDKSISK